MIESLIVAVFSSSIAWMSVRANARFARDDRLPMQWWITGEVTWTAPRVVALAFTPALAFLALSAIAVASACYPSRAVADGEALWRGAAEDLRH